MIKMKALRSANMGPNAAKVRRGREFVVDTAHRAKELEDHGLAYPVEVKAESTHLNKMEPPPSNKAAEAGPLDSVGGATGEVEPAPSSPRVRQPRQRRSNRSTAQDLLS